VVVDDTDNAEPPNSAAFAWVAAVCMAERVDPDVSGAGVDKAVNVMGLEATVGRPITAVDIEPN
jgi:hypothetical protein